MKTILHNKIALVALFGVLAFIVPALTFASPVLRSGETVSVEADQLVEGDFYAGGNAVTVSGEIKGDAYIGGGAVTVNAPVSEDLVIAGGTVQVHGPVADDLRIVGGEVTLADSVEGDVVVIGGALRLLSTASVKGDILFVGKDIELAGTVEGSLFGYGDTVKVLGPVGGDVSVSVQRALELGDRAQITGDISYSAPQELTRAPGATVEGDIQYKPQSVAGGGDSARVILIPLMVSLFAALVLMLILRRQLQHIVDDTLVTYGSQGLLGLGVFVGTPVVAFILLVSVLGLWLGFMLLFGYLFLLAAAWVVTGIVFGSVITKYVTKSTSVTLTSVIAGTILLDVIAFIPVIGPLFVFALLLITLGGISRRFYRAVI